MANTITYDPANDPQVDEANAARDAENLAQGEKMAEEQSDLLAGKYKSAEELERGYLELQRQLGKGEEAPQQQQDVDPNVTPYQEDGSVDYDTVETVYGEQITNVMEDAGIDPWKRASHFNDNEGTLTPQMTDELVNAGFPRETVEAYLQGQRQQMGFTPTVENLSDAEVREVQNLAGGKAAYDNLTQWAEQNLPQADVDAFDEVINTGNKAAVRFAVKALNAQYEDAVGRSPDLVTGKTSTRGDKYRSMAEVVRDMSDPQYDTNDAYRLDIQRKLERSNLNV